MPAYILVKAIDGWNPEDPFAYLTGYPVNARNHNRIGGKQVPPEYVQVVITDAEPEQVKAYCKMWRRFIDYEIEDSNFATDVHQVRVFTKPELVSASGLNNLTRDKVESWLNRWNMIVTGASARNVNFEAGIFNAIKSEAFWEEDPVGVTFEETDYVPSTGIHSVRAYYTGAPIADRFTKLGLEDFLTVRGAVVTSHPTGRVNFDISRASMLEWYKQEVKSKIDDVFARRKWYFTRAAVDLALANAGTLTATRQQALNYLHNRLLD